MEDSHELVSTLSEKEKHLLELEFCSRMMVRNIGMELSNHFVEGGKSQSPAGEKMKYLLWTHQDGPLCP